jgi:hypothetical protein
MHGQNIAVERSVIPFQVEEVLDPETGHHGYFCGFPQSLQTNARIVTQAR